MKAGFLRWANSIHAHLLALALVVILTLTAFSLTLLLYFIPPERVPLSVYEIARIVHGQPLLRDEPVVHEVRQAAAPPASTDPADRLIAALLAPALKQALAETGQGAASICAAMAALGASSAVVSVRSRRRASVSGPKYCSDCQ